MHPGDIGAQAEATLQIIARALADGGFAVSDVVRTRMYVTDISLADVVIAVHGRWFGEIRPAATLVEVARLIEPSLLIEIEVDATH
jgi:enamine deaminase RidA (YjgF/YER057c/UK114 family)